MPERSKDLAESLERLVPDEVQQDEATGSETLELHLERYRFAVEHAAPGRLLDMACGVGYGSRLLADQREDLDVTGVDLSDQAVAYARDRYAAERVTFNVGDAMSYGEPQSFDTVVSLETIEHVPDANGLVRHLRSLLRPGGVLVASVPTTPSVDANPHHLSDFTEPGFRAMMTDLGLTEVGVLRQIQPFSPLPLLARTEHRAAEIRPGLPGYYVRNPSALFRRLWATLRFGFTNRYVTLALRSPQ